jgi:hypothetical protein
MPCREARVPPLPEVRILAEGGENRGERASEHATGRPFCATSAIRFPANIRREEVGFRWENRRLFFDVLQDEIPIGELCGHLKGQGAFEG